MTMPNTNAQAMLARSRPLLEAHRAPLQRAIGRYMARTAGDGAPAARHFAAGRALLAWLLGGRVPTGLETTDFARFGDGLAAVLRDVLGDRVTPPLLWVWGDKFWHETHSARARRLRLAA